jgi:hypothetical protein
MRRLIREEPCSLGDRDVENLRADRDSAARRSFRWVEYANRQVLDRKFRMAVRRFEPGAATRIMRGV